MLFECSGQVTYKSKRKRYIPGYFSCSIFIDCNSLTVGGRAARAAAAAAARVHVSMCHNLAPHSAPVPYPFRMRARTFCTSRALGVAKEARSCAPSGFWSSAYMHAMYQ